MNAAAPLLIVNSATKRFGGLTAVDGVSFDLQKDEIVGVIGPNGAGKSTLFNLISGIAPLTKGDVTFAGRDMGQVPAHARSAIGMTRTFQIVRLFGHLSVLDNVMLGGHCRMTQGFVTSLLRLPEVLADSKRLRENSMEWLEFVGLSARANDTTEHLPHGQQRLLEIARAMIADPRLVLLDEPAAGLNGAETAQLLDITRKLNTKGVAVLIVEHDMKFIMNLCHRIVVLDHGARIAAGKPDEVRRDPAVLEAYLGRKAADAAH
ncbi:branched-chain amino acid transport system ATP-binding protein [Nitrobacteraceae bacterium AZCC 2161]